MAIVVGSASMVFYLYVANRLLDTLLADTLLQSHSRLRERVRPWLFVGPALVVLTIFLIYPTLQTILFSFYAADSNAFVGLTNYQWAQGDVGFGLALRNNLLWLLVVPFACTLLGLLIAVLSDRVRWESFAQSLIFMPLAISFVGAAVIWRFVYAYRPADETQIGLLNALGAVAGLPPNTWYTEPPFNNLALMVILIWIQTGFATVVLSAALKSVPQELIEAARIDGATEPQILLHILIPQIIGALTVVVTNTVIIVLNVFDIVFTMTGGQFQTEVLANYMYRWQFRNFDNGRGSVIAVTILLTVIPLLVWNIIRFRREEANR
jgi:alpha-glucoside transport system permease protein